VISAAATFCATLVDEWIRRGVRHAVVCPGSRSTPVALAVTARSELAVHVVHDERSAAFVTLGLGLDGVPALLVCTSGTAAVNFHPAVVEAGLSDVSMLVLTADRPPELRGVGAPQTIDQVELYGTSVRWFHDAPVPADEAVATWRPLAAAAFEASRHGPVHLNLPFREPLVGEPAPLPASIDPPLIEPDTTVAPALGDDLVAELDQPRGLIVAGGRSGVSPTAIADLAAATSWPVVADPISGARVLPGAITTFDALVRHERFAADHRPQVVVRVGRPMLSRVFNEWLAASPKFLVQVGGPGVIDPDLQVDAVLDPRHLTALADRLRGATGTPWLARWTAAERRAHDAIVAVLAEQARLSEPRVARLIADHRPDGARVVTAASMPMRDLEWYGGPRAVAHANRGANGIDGIASTALGIALGGAPVIAHLGDIAFVHDTNALVGLARRDADLRIVVTDNDGGAIFSFLPQATALDHDRFEQLFGTPHGTDVVAIAAAHGIPACTATTADELVAAITTQGPSVTRVASDRNDNVAVHRALNAAVAAALSA
jgi:2-succinyl-5-enolpyruvyl-6-hydroxy-3-cyclohexene-1-carboxylate synthase